MTPNEIVRFTMRLEKPLLIKIEKLAQKNKRSKAKEIEFILEKALEKKSI